MLKHGISARDVMTIDIAKETLRKMQQNFVDYRSCENEYTAIQVILERLEEVEKEKEYWIETYDKACKIHNRQ